MVKFFVNLLSTFTNTQEQLILKYFTFSIFKAIALFM